MRRFLKDRIQTMSVLAFAGCVWTGAAAPAAAQDLWVAPEEEKARKNPVAASAESIQIGQDLYETNCMACHGLAGKGDGPTAKMRSYAVPDMTSHAWSAGVTDGEMFWKISTGKMPMKAYENDFTEEERWHLVNFLRTFSKSGEAAKAPAKLEEAGHGAELHALPPKPAAAAEGEVMSYMNQKPWVILSLVGAIVMGAFFAIIGTGAPEPLPRHDDAHGHH